MCAFVSLLHWMMTKHFLYALIFYITKDHIYFIQQGFCVCLS